MEQDNLDNWGLELRNPDNKNQPFRVVRSYLNTNKVDLRFVNLTDRKVNLIWMNFNGSGVVSSILPKKGDYCDMNTFENHPWIAADAYTRDKFLLDRQLVFYPRPFEPPKRFSHLVNPSQRIRRKVQITLPLYSLKYISLLTIRNLLKPTADVDSLELPRELSNDLKRLIFRRYHEYSWEFIGS